MYVNQSIYWCMSIRYTSAQIPGRQVAAVTEFCTVMANVCESLVWNVPHHPSDA